MQNLIKVLIADDNPVSRGGLGAVLATCPEIEVVSEASNGWEAVCLMEQVHPDVVLMDVHMPKMDGLEATRCIKSYWPDVQVILLTICPNYQANATGSGADAVVAKGCPVEELLKAILYADYPKQSL